MKSPSSTSESEASNSTHAASVTSDPAQPVALFQGYDTFLGAGRSKAVSGSYGSGGKQASVYYQVCYDLDSLSRSLKVSASASFTSPQGSISAKTEYINNLSVTNTSVSIVVYSNQISDNRVATNASMNIAPPSDDSSSVDQFCQQYGDSYLTKIVKGGEYAATYVFYSSTVEEQEKITAELEANGISSSGSLSVSFQSSLETVTKNISTRQMMQQYISGVSAELPSSDDVVQFAMGFSGLELSDPVVIDWSTETYNRAGSMPSIYSKVITNVRLFDGTESKLGLCGQYEILKAVKDSIEWVDEVYQTYGYTDDSELDEKSAIVDDDLATLEALFQQMSSSPTTSYELPQLPALELGQPTLSCSVTNNDAWGGDGGKAFDDVEVTTIVNMAYVTSVTLRGGRYVDQISTIYDYGGDLGPRTETHGEDGGTGGPALALASGERITSVSALYGTHVNRLDFSTSAGNEMSWPPNPRPAGNVGTWSEEGSQRLLGFAGRSATYVDRLTLRLGTFAPAIWVPC